jgi:hypothetical protein
MTDLKETADVLVRLYWDRPAVEAELVAMAGEMDRDSRAIAPPRGSGENVFFALEPSSFDALMASEEGA